VKRFRIPRGHEYTKQLTMRQNVPIKPNEKIRTIFYSEGVVPEKMSNVSVLFKRAYGSHGHPSIQVKRVTMELKNSNDEKISEQTYCPEESEPATLSSAPPPTPVMFKAD
jgi:hypothetical protein